MPFDLRLYPKNWRKVIRPAVLARADHCCESCKVRNFSVGYRNEKRDFIRVHGNIDLDLAGEGLKYPSLQRLTYKEAREIADLLNALDDDGSEFYIVIVLAIAHLDHNPANNAMNNLKALCQRCHLNYDRRDNSKRHYYGKNYLLNQLNLFHNLVVTRREKRQKPSKK